MNKRIGALVLALALLLGTLGGVVQPVMSGVMQEAPNAAIVQNRLLIGGVNISAIKALTYQFVLIRAADSAVILPKNFTEDILTKHRVNVDPESMKAGCVQKYQPIELQVGDVLYLRKLDSTGAAQSEWKSITMAMPMFALSSATSSKDLPTLQIGESWLHVYPADRYTSYEYAVIDGSGEVKWTEIGSAAAMVGDYINVSLMPRSTSYYVRVRVTGDDRSGYLYRQVAGIPVGTPRVFLNEEVLGPFGGGKSGKSWYVSTDGGKKFTRVTAAAGVDRYVDLEKVFGKKEVEIIVKPVEYNADGTEKAPEDINATIVRQMYNPRPVFSKEIKTIPMASEKYYMNYSFTGYQTNQSYQYRIEGQMSEYSRIDFAVGLPLLTALEQSSGRKPAKVLLRTPPDESTYTPASQPRKFTQVKQTKAPKSKPDYKKETLKTKNGVFYAVGPVGLQPELLTYKPTNGDILPISDWITEEQCVYLYQCETDKKSRSAYQLITFAPRFDRPDEGEGYTLDNKGKLKLVKGYEALGTGEKWGNLKKGETAVQLRKKTNAKFNSKSGTSTGYAASLANTMSISYDDDGKTVLAVAMTGKKYLPLQSLAVSVPSGGNGHIAYAASSGGNIYNPNVRDYSFAQLQTLDSKYNPRPSTFYLSLSELLDDLGKSMIDTITLTCGEREIAYNGSYYTCDEGYAGDTFTLTLTPVDRDAYRTTVFTIKIIEPVLSSPSSAWFGPAAGEMGKVTVRLAAALKANDELTLAVRLVKLEATGEREIAKKTAFYEYDQEDTANNNDFLFYFHEEIAAAGKGVYRVYASKVGEKGESSDSEARASSDLVVGPADLKLCVVKTETVLNNDGIAVDQFRVREALDMLGNDLTSFAAFQWYRSDKPITEAAPGDPINRSSSTFQLEDEYAGQYIGVKVTALGAFSYTSFGLVKRTLRLHAQEDGVIIANDSPELNPDTQEMEYPGRRTLEFSYSGLNPEHQLVLFDESMTAEQLTEALVLTWSVEHNPAVPQPDPETGETDPGPGEDDPVIADILPEHITIDTIESVICIDIEALNNGQAEVTLKLLIGSKLTEYIRDPQPSSNCAVKVEHTEY